MKKIRKKIVAGFLAVCLAFTQMPVDVYGGNINYTEQGESVAEETVTKQEEEGTSENSDIVITGTESTGTENTGTENSKVTNQEGSVTETNNANNTNTGSGQEETATIEQNTNSGLDSDVIISEEAEAVSLTEEEASGYPAVSITSNIQSAIDTISVSDSKTGIITLDKDYSENITITKGATVVLDLNGHTLSAALDGNTITVYGTLLITDKSVSKSGKISGQAISNGRGIDILSGGSCYLEGGSIEGFSIAGNGAGVIVENNAYFEMNGGSIKNNTASSNGGGIYTYDLRNFKINGGIISSNSAEYGGGVYFFYSPHNEEKYKIEIKDVTVDSNTATGCGGGLYFEYGCYISLTGDTKIINNAANGLGGGGIYFSGISTLSLDSDTCVISGNKALNPDETTNYGNGGGVYFLVTETRNGSAFILNKGKVDENEAYRNGGGICFAEYGMKAPYQPVKININGGEILKNISGNFGGGIYTYRRSEVTITDGLISENKTYQHGAGIYIDSENNVVSKFNMSGGTISKNSATANLYTARYGGGVYIGNRSESVISGGVIEENYNMTYGGGLYFGNSSKTTIEGTIEIRNNIVSHASGGYGAGLYVADSATFTMTGGKVYGNTSSDNYVVSGAGIYINNYCTSEITGGEIYENESYRGNGGGLYSGNGIITLGGNVKIHDNRILGGGSGNGAGVNVRNAYFTDNAEVYNNTSVGCNTGGLYCAYQFMMDGGKIYNNKALNIGGIFLDTLKTDPSYISGGEIYGNIAETGYGGGIYLRGTTGSTTNVDKSIITIDKDTRIYDNTCKTNGGGIYSDYASRIILKEQASITGNTAGQYGGGIYVSYYQLLSYRDKSPYTLEVLGGSIRENFATAGGNDVALNHDKSTNWYKGGYSFVKPSSMYGASATASWLYENDSSYITAAYTKTDSTATSMGMQLYTFLADSKIVAKIGNTGFSRVQYAVNAIKNGKNSGTIVMVDDSMEDVIIPDNLSVSLDLNGYTITGAAASVFTVNTGATLTVKDTSGDNSGCITGGRGVKDASANAICGGAFFVKGTLNFEGGTITKNSAKHGAAIYVDNGGTLNFKGGIITENYENYNKGTSCSIICGYRPSSKNTTGKAIINITGGKITGNNGTAVATRNSGLSEITIRNAEITDNKSTYNDYASAVVLSVCGKVTIEDSRITGNISSSYAGGIYVDGASNNILISNSEISGNVGKASYGSGIYVGGTAFVKLDKGTIITDNINSAGNNMGAGITVNSTSSTLDIEAGVKIYNNSSSGYAKDLYLNNGVVITGDGRFAENMSVSGIDCWYDISQNIYYVETKDAASQEIVENFSNVINPANNKVTRTLYLKAAAVEDGLTYVARIDDTYYTSIFGAVTAANSMTETDITIHLLKDVTESAVISNPNKNITLDLEGHTVTANKGSSSVFSVIEGNLSLTSSVGQGYIVPNPDDTNSLTRAIYVSGTNGTGYALAGTRGSFTLMDGVTIKDFSYTGNGAAIYNENNSKGIYIHGGTIENCYSTESGGAIYFNAALNVAGRPIQFEMTGGEIKNCTVEKYGGAIYINDGAANTTADIKITGGLFELNKTNINEGGAIYYNGANNAIKHSNVEIYGASFKNNSSYGSGGAIYATFPGDKNNESPFILGKEGYETIFDGNSSINGECGAILFTASNSASTNNGSIKLTNVICRNNNALKGSVGGIKIESMGYTEVTGCEISGNEAYNYYGGVYLRSTSFLVRNCKIHDNKSKTTYYGGLYVAGLNSFDVSSVDGTYRLVEGCDIYNNSSIYGGNASLYIEGNLNKELTIKNCNIYNNIGTSTGAGLTYGANSSYSGAIINIDSCDIYGNTAVSGAGIAPFQNNYFNGNIVNIYGTTKIHDNISNGGTGGGIYCYTQDPNSHGNSVYTISGDVEIYNNTAKTGGGIYSINSDLIISDNVKIYNNTATTEGGGIYYYPSLNTAGTSTNYLFETSDNVKISNNTAYLGGGIRLLSGGRTNVITNLNGGAIEGNTATKQGSDGGGGIYISNSSAFDMTTNINCSVTGNTANARGGGIYVSSANVNAGTIVNVGEGALIKDNEAVMQGGGAYVDGALVKFNLNSGGKIYSNKALLGQDVYANKGLNLLKLISASDMLSDTPELIANCWIDENTTKTYDSEIRFISLAKEYPLTLRYSTKKTVAVVDDKPFDSVQAAIQAIFEGQTVSNEIIMVDDSVESAAVPTGLSVKLNLNGYTLAGSGGSALSCYGDTIICDEPKTVTASGTEYTSGAGTGKITGTAAYGGGVFVDGCNVTMKSGLISECISGSNTKADGYGGAVCIKSGQFTLDGGKICDNTATNSYGSAVYISSAAGSFVMTSGEINNNQGTFGTIANNGGKVQISGGFIRNNKVSDSGGAIYNKGGTSNVSINGTVVEITNNTAAQKGGAIYNDTGTLTIGKALISGNQTTAVKQSDVTSQNNLSYGGGGAIFVNNGTVNISDGAEIKNNKAVRGGAIYQINGTVNIMGGVITQNTALLGGGVAQSPVNSGVVNFSKGKVYGNSSVTTAAGNDFYSAWEGSTAYSNKTPPKMTLIAANKMNLSAYNVWKDDSYSVPDGEEGNMTAEVIGEGMYVTGYINQSNNLQLTAKYYKTDAAPSVDDYLRTDKLTIVENSETDKTGDGTVYFDDGTNGLDDAAPKEVFAIDLLNNGEATESELTYKAGNDTYKYISYNGKLYERNQAVEWWPGNDSSIKNNIIRSYDKLTYTIERGLSYDSMDEIEAGDYIINVWYEYRLDASSREATFDVTNLGMESYSIVSMTDESGKEYQVLTGFESLKVTITEDESGKKIPEGIGNKSRNVEIWVNGMVNGDTLKPSFKCWVEGHEDKTAEAVSKIKTVSSAPKYNVSLGTNSTLQYEGYFDIANNVEISKTDYLANQSNPNYVHGMMVGYGVTVSMYNEPARKGLKGLEIPEDELEFDLSFKNTVYCEGKYVTHDVAPYVWAYKENTLSNSGKAVGESTYTVNMNWDDPDDLVKTTYYAFDGAPLNSGDSARACYSGGNWNMSYASGGADNEILTHVKLTGYSFPSTSTKMNSNPNQSSDGKTNISINGDNVKAFSAGYVQMIIPIDKSDYNKNGEKKLNGNVSFNLEAAVSNLDAKGVSGNSPAKIEEDYPSTKGLSEDAKKADLDAMNNYYGYTFSESLITDGYAVNEKRYSDNYAVKSVAALIIDGDGPGSLVEKVNKFFSNDTDKEISNDLGTGDTALGSIVKIYGGFDFLSQSWRVDDIVNEPEHYALNKEYYDSELFSSTEINYMTAANLLQKFDGEVYVPETCEKVIDLTVQGNFNNAVFNVSTSESATDWDANATKTYDLTILYAAKPDGTNWTKIDNSADYSSDPGSFDDGGVTEMDNYREENLIYFESLEELHEYFGGTTKGTCVGILYQFRNCCIRSGRSVRTYVKTQVTNDFEYTGKTYCTTNDVRTWTTYRPFYKLLFNQGIVKNKLYSFTWDDLTYKEANGVKAYGAALAVTDGECEDLEAYYGTNTELYSLYSENDRMAADSIGIVPFEKGPVDYHDDYNITKYKSGTKILSTHNGDYKGNTLLLYTLNTDIDIYVKDKLENSNASKDTYYVAKGERIANFTVVPNVQIASSAKKTGIVENGTISTRITIEIDIPENLKYIPGSLEFDYDVLDSNKERICNYNDGDLVWNVDSSVDGKLILSTYVSDIEMGLPYIYFGTEIGKVDDPENDVVNGDQLTVRTSIKADYEEQNILASKTHEDAATIKISIEKADGIFMTVEDQLLEIGEDLIYTLYYKNLKGEQTDVQIIDVLPFNGDGRGTSFTGGYRVKSINVKFSDEETYQEFKSTGKFKYALDKKEEAEATGQKALFNDINENGNELTFAANDAELTLSISVTDDMVQYADNGTGGIALFAEAHKVPHEGYITITVDMSPENSDESSLIESTTGTYLVQTGDNHYVNQFYYRKATLTDTGLKSNPAQINTIKREISGVVWMDQNQNGLYDSAAVLAAYKADIEAGYREATMVERPISDIKVYLYLAEVDASGKVKIKTDEFGNKVVAKDTIGNDIEPVMTDKTGRYVFTQLPEGDYLVAFDEDSGTEYKYMTSETEASHPIDFDKLSVTSDEYKELVNANRSIATYQATDSLDGAVTYKLITLPNKDEIEYNTYTSPNWNLGLYYIDMSLQKEWSNMYGGVPIGTTISFGVYGKVGDTEVYKGNCNMTQTESGVSASYTDNAGGEELTNLTIEFIDEKPIYRWKLTPDLILPAENADGKIEYTLVESDVLDKNANSVKEYYNVEMNQEFDKMTCVFKNEILNSQKVGSITVFKKTGSDDALNGAEFSVFIDEENVNINSLDGAYYKSEKEGTSKSTGADKNRLGTAIKKGTTVLSYKMDIGNAAEFETLKAAGLYDERNNLLTVGDSQFLVHKENLNTGGENKVNYYYLAYTEPESLYKYVVGDAEALAKENYNSETGLIVGNNGISYILYEETVDGKVQYYYYTTRKPYGYSGIVKSATQVSVVEFTGLELYDDEGNPIYYTVRETKVPNGYISLGNFNILTGIDLFKGYPVYDSYNTVIDYTRDVCFEVENTVQMKLPVTGGGGFSIIVIIGTMMIMLGGCFIFIMYRRKKFFGEA